MWMFLQWPQSFGRRCVVPSNVLTLTEGGMPGRNCTNVSKALLIRLVRVVWAVRPSTQLSLLPCLAAASELRFRRSVCQIVPKGCTVTLLLLVSIVMPVVTGVEVTVILLPSRVS